MARALLLGGTGAIGYATAHRLVTSGWDVEVTGRDPARFPVDLKALGVRFTRSDRHDPSDVSAVLRDGADLVVDLACFDRTGAQQLLAGARDATSLVVVSSKGVYVDAGGRHPNSTIKPHFSQPIRETQPTMAPGSGDYMTREGYGANKVAAEEELLASALPVTVLRPSKVYGRYARRPREWYFVKRALDRREYVVLADRGASVDHTSAAMNVAALIECVAHNPGTRVLNCADPDAPDVATIARTVAAYFNVTWDVVALEDAPEGVGRSPWYTPHPIVLDTSASLALGYQPVGDFATCVQDTLQWLASVATGDDGAQLPDYLDVEFFRRFFDYGAEDAFVRAHER